MPRCSPGASLRSITRNVGLIAALSLSLLLMSVLPTTAGTAWAGETRYVAPGGSDSGPGTSTQPYGTLAAALRALQPGDTLVVRGGTYRERIMSPSLRPGTPTARIQVVAAPGERPVVEGLLWLKGASYWDVRGVNVTWSTNNSASEHMVKLTGGTGWTFTDSEIWGARSFAAVLVAGDAADWTFARNHVHDTHPSNGTNQDHLVYANSGSGGGVIERNLLVGSPNGRAVKVGPPSKDTGIVENLTIRHNTMVDNHGPSNVQLAWGSSNVQVYRNIMVSPGPNRSAVTAYQLTGTGSVVQDNLGWATSRLLDTGVAGLADGGGNVLADPGLDASYRPTAAVGADYGHLAPGGTPTPVAPAPAPAPVEQPAPAPSAPSQEEPLPATPTVPLDPDVAVVPGLAISASPAYGIGTPAAGQIVVRGARASANETADRLTLTPPSSTTAGDVLVAAIDVRGRPVVTAPAGWHQVLATDNGDTMRKVVFWRVAGAAEPRQHEFRFSRAQAAAGTIVALAGVATDVPTQWASSAAAPARALVTPAVARPAEGSLALALFGTATSTSVLPGAGLSAAAEGATTSGSYHVTSQVSIDGRGTGGAASAYANRTAASVNALLVLTPAA